MRSFISEFSYGFALTRELVASLGTLTVAPVFPSLVDEANKGWDVNLDAPGFPLFIQFKRSEEMKRRSAKEIKAGATLGVPFYRLTVTGSGDSAQHQLLWDLDHPPNRVFYAAPLFYLKADFDRAYLADRSGSNRFLSGRAASGYSPMTNRIPYRSTGTNVS